MAKKIYVRYVQNITEQDVSDVPKEKRDEIIKQHCFRAYLFSTAFEALSAYANTTCDWSTLLEENADVKSFIDEAYEHIKNKDYEWLEQNFT
jgi:hypothetical protein